MPEFIEQGGVRTAFEVTGSGPPLLTMHGGEGSRRQFAAIAPELTDRYTLIAYDQRDCGETVNPESPATLADLADDARSLLAALGYSSAFVLGTSFGGRVAQALAVRHPSFVRRLVLASTWPLPVSLAAVHAEVASELNRLRSNLPASAEQLADYFFPAAFLSEQPAFGRHFASTQARSEKTQRRAAVIGDVPDMDISRIEQPTLLVAGALDRVVPSEITLSIANLIRDTTSFVLPDVGHLSLAQAPKIVAQRLREFLV